MWQFWPIFSIEIWFLDTQNYILCHCEGSQKCIFHALCISAILLSDQSSSKQKGRIGDFILIWDSFILGRFVVFCWYPLFLGDLSGDLKLMLAKNSSFKYSRIDLRLDRKWHPLTPSDDPTQWDLGSNQTWKCHVWIQIEICSQLLWLVSVVWPLEELVHGLEVLCS